jgi:hypothetical protein
MPDQQSTTERLVPTCVLRIREGDLVDLESCPYLNRHTSAKFEFGVVNHVEQETAGCVAIGFEGIDVIGYQVDTVLNVIQPRRYPLH